MTQPQWYVVLSKPKQEKIAAEHLRQQGGEVFLPLFRRERIIRGKRVQTEEPLFPGYLFLHIASDSPLLYKVRYTIGARKLLVFGDQPITVSTVLINDLRLRSSNGNNEPLYKTGQKVTLMSGPFRNYEAIFREFNGKERATILLSILGQQSELLVDLDELVAQ